MSNGTTVIFEDKQLQQFLMQLNHKGEFKGGDLFITDYENVVTTHIFYWQHVVSIQVVY